ncbi:hypothetical protein [Roseibium sp.]|uniref:hypothetical protein n=1 Tax=Roseibium sp. TaxID=1936156 RepID=UPI003A987C2D
MKNIDRQSFTQALWTTTFVVGCSIACYRIISWFFGRLDAWGLWTIQGLPIAAFALALLLRNVKAGDVATPFRLLNGGLAVILGTYGLLSPISYPVGEAFVSDTMLLWFSIASFLQLGCGVLAVFRPAFAIVPPAFVLALKEATDRLYDIHMSNTDYVALIDLSIFGFGALASFHLLSRQTWLPSVATLTKRYGLQNWTLTAFLTSVAIHFGNYFYSAIAKMKLDGGPFLWVQSNPTELLAYNAWSAGFLPLAHWETFSAATLIALGTLRPVSNVLLFVGQAVSVFCLWRRWAMIAVTLFYDLTHVAIFAVSGIFFWKWILLNLLLVAAMRKIPVDFLRAPIILVNSAVLLASPLIFHIVWLGWYDTPALTKSSVIAVLKDNREMAVPTNYFGSVSVVFAQHDLGRTVPGHFPTGTWGSTKSDEILFSALTSCSLPPDGKWHLKADQEQIKRPIELIHRYALQREKRFGDYHYDLYPHHIWSNPMLYDEFASVLPSEIDHYLYRTESVCVSHENGFPVENPVLRDDLKVRVSTNLD